MDIYKSKLTFDRDSTKIQEPERPYEKISLMQELLMSFEKAYEPCMCIKV